MLIEFLIPLALLAPLPERQTRPVEPLDPDHVRLAAEYSEALLGISFLVLQGGEVLHASWANGGFPEWSQELASGTKSFSGLMAAAAAHDGLLELDEPVADTIVEWREDPRLARVTIRQLLSLTSGLDARVDPRLERAAALEVAAVEEPGAEFRYGTAPFQVFGELLERKLEGRSALAWLEERLLDPIGVEVGRWKHGSDGHPRLASGAALTAHEWAELGEWMRRALDPERFGTRAGGPLIASELLAECVRGSEANPGYGLTFWLRPPTREAFMGRATGAAATGRARRNARKAPQLERLPEDFFMAAGAGNQRLYVIPSLDLVVVRQATGVGASMLGVDVPFSDAELLARLLFGEAADGGEPETPELSRIAERVRERAAEQLSKLRAEADEDGDGQLSEDEVARLDARIELADEARLTMAPPESDSAREPGAESRGERLRRWLRER